MQQTSQQDGQQESEHPCQSKILFKNLNQSQNCNKHYCFLDLPKEKETKDSKLEINSYLQEQKISQILDMNKEIKEVDQGLIKQETEYISGNQQLQSDQKFKECKLMKSKHLKIFECQICKIKLTRKDNLLKHIKNIHNKQKRFHCNVCYKYFTEKGNLNVHLRTHSGSKPFKCEICSTSFTSKGNLEDHLKRHYKQRRFQLNKHFKKFHYSNENMTQLNLNDQNEIDDIDMKDYDREVLKSFLIPLSKNNPR
ncbi:zinc finger [Stylonychia lemnae]|uniref:Zinc finger n=1 Tax=Stylonychia lemnae TaxID=5949 RepID=A0A078A2A6_STYLE|nr:zinc finger [Stylonychia lemnae]|eukprot:CDW76270.1 zinc finger [Stylonychia lemnae]